MHLPKKFITFILVTAVLFLTGNNSVQCAETNETTSDHLTRLQNEISSDISKLRASAETELSGLKLNSPDIARRIQELTALSENASNDMAAWGYTPEQREIHLRILSELSLAYTSYGAVLQTLESSPEGPKSNDIALLGNTVSPDIFASDNMRKEISKLSRGIDVQVFYLQSKISRLKLDLSEAATLQKQLKTAQDGGKALEFPHTHILDLELARIKAAFSRLQLRTEMALFDKNITAIQRRRRRLADMQSKLSFSQQALDDRLAKIQERIGVLTTELSESQKALDSANSALVKAKAAMGSADVTPLTAVSVNYLVRQARVSYWEYMFEMLVNEIELNREAQEIWRTRYRLFHDEVPGEEIWKIRESSLNRIQELQRQLDGVRALEAETLRQVEQVQAQADSEGVTGAIRQSIIQAADSHRKMVAEVFNRFESLLPNIIFLVQRLNAEANDNLSAVRIAEKVSSFSKETIMGFLNTELWQGEGYSVTVSKLAIAIMVLLSSFFLSSWGSNAIKRRIMRRAKASITAANAIQRIVFYILWIAFALIALNIVDIPLTAFAFMGGAMAVGIGFGMQNIFNNLISGFIVIFSRPFKVNDIIDVAGTQGTVTDIGSRSTTIKTWDGFDVVLPNRYFLENSVTNWTGADVKKREILKVSVSYESDTRKVEKILIDVAKEHSQVLKDPAPFVIFKNFGDDGLEFEIYYWIELRKSSGMKVSSDMRHHIAAVFSREGIEVPYPQRVIHFAHTPKAEDTEKINEVVKNDGASS
ncbi:MAG: mechanosensitive ion channel [Synergistaceae bacterium]|nr:mechanosensitive ion channel [Synergistaceae bacterium]